MTEDQLQRAVAKVLDASGLTWCHVPNGGKRSAITGAIMKAQGVKAGVPDVLIFEPFLVRVEVPMLKARAFTIDDIIAGKKSVTESRIACGVAIELKVGKNKPSPAQLEWHRRLAGHGWRVKVCYTLDEVLDVLQQCYPDKFPAI